MVVAYYSVPLTMDEVEMQIFECRVEKMIDLIYADSIRKHVQETKHIDNDILETAFENVDFDELLDCILRMLTDMQLPSYIFLMFSLNVRCQKWWANTYSTESRKKRICKLAEEMLRCEAKFQH